MPPLIRTLALEPDILLLDEPFSALDYQTRLSVCDDISTIIRGRHKTAILITPRSVGGRQCGGSDYHSFKEAGKDQRNTAHPIFHTGLKPS